MYSIKNGTQSSCSSWLKIQIKFVYPFTLKQLNSAFINKFSIEDNTAFCYFCHTYFIQESSLKDSWTPATDESEW